MPTARTFTSTSPAFGEGTGISSSLSTSGPPNEWMTAAFIVCGMSFSRCRSGDDLSELCRDLLVAFGKQVVVQPIIIRSIEAEIDEQHVRHHDRLSGSPGRSGGAA